MTRRIHIIAEMACSHEGRPDLARKIIDGAAAAKADSIQFQIWKLGEMMVPQHPDFERVSRIELSRQEWTSLADYVHQQHKGLQIIACVYERDSVDFAMKIGVDAFKLHSADLSNPFLVKYVASTGKRIDLSVGASTVDEIATAVEWIRGASSSEIWLMYGYQNFPTPTDAIRLEYMMNLRSLFHLPIGYQDHTDGNDPAAFWIPAAALGLGADILEKHITHDRAFKGFDHESALNPDEFLEFTRMVRTLEQAMGNGAPQPFSAEEMKYRRYSKKSLVASRDLPAGQVLSESDLMPMRAEALGLPPDQLARLVGRRTNAPIAKYQLVLEDKVT